MLEIPNALEAVEAIEQGDPIIIIIIIIIIVDDQDAGTAN